MSNIASLIPAKYFWVGYETYDRAAPIKASPEIYFSFPEALRAVIPFFSALSSANSINMK